MPSAVRVLSNMHDLQQGKEIVKKWARIMWDINVDFSCYVGDGADEIHTGLLASPDLANAHLLGPKMCLEAAPTSRQRSIEAQPTANGLLALPPPPQEQLLQPQQ